MDATGRSRILKQNEWLPASVRPRSYGAGTFTAFAEIGASSIASVGLPAGMAERGRKCIRAGCVFVLADWCRPLWHLDPKRADTHSHQPGGS